jgi:hypothetical protein
MRGVPRITHLLEQADGGTATVVAALRLCDDDDACKFLEKYDSISESDKGRLSIEEIAVAAEVGTKRLLELAVSSLVEDSKSAGAIIAASFHPKVVRASARYAMTPLGDADRKLFLSATGFTPQTKNAGGGVFVTINQTQQQLAQARADGLVEGEVGGTGEKAFDSADEELKTLHEALDGSQKSLPEPKVIENASSAIIGHSYEKIHEGEVEEASCIPNAK